MVHYQVMQDTDGDYYIVSDKYAPRYDVASMVEGMFQLTECTAEDLGGLKACPELSATKLAFEWYRRKVTWQAMIILKECLDAKLPGELPPEKIYEKKEFKLSDTASAIRLDMVSLADLCKDKKWDPSQVRRILRKAGLKPQGRWEWPKSQINEVISLVAKGYK